MSKEFGFLGLPESGERKTGFEDFLENSHAFPPLTSPRGVGVGDPHFCEHKCRGHLDVSGFCQEVPGLGDVRNMHPATLLDHALCPRAGKGQHAMFPGEHRDLMLAFRDNVHGTLSKGSCT